MTLPNKLMLARMNDSTIGSSIDDKVGQLEQAIADIFGIPIDSLQTAAALGVVDAAGRLTAALRFAAASNVAGGVYTGVRIRDTTAGNEALVTVEGAALKFYKNTGTEAVPIWTQVAAIDFTTGVLSTGITTFLGLTDTPASYAGKAGWFLLVNPGETALIFGQITARSLSDVPDSYAGAGTKLLRVNAAETGIEFHAPVFATLGDVPASYAGHSLRVVRVAAAENALEFAALALNDLSDVIDYTASDAYKALTVSPSGGSVKTAEALVCAASRTAAQTIPTGADTKITWTGEDDAGGMLTPPDTDFHPPVSGYYLVTARGTFSANATGKRMMSIAKNSVTLFNGSLEAGDAVLSSGVQVNAILDLAFTDYVEISVFQTSGGDLAIQNCYCEIALVR